MVDQRSGNDAHDEILPYQSLSVVYPDAETSQLFGLGMGMRKDTAKDLCRGTGGREQGVGVASTKRRGVGRQERR